MKKAMKTILAGCALALLPAAAALADGGPLDNKIKVGLDGASAVDAFKSFAELIDAEAVVDPALQGRKVTIKVENVRVRTILDAMCESVDCRWELREGNPAKLRVTALGVSQTAVKMGSKGWEKEAIDLKVDRADARDLLKTFAALIGAEIALDPGVTGQVTVELENVPAAQALDTVCERVGCAWAYVERGGGKPLLQVTPRKE